MSLIKCPECKKKISSESKTCVHCGFPVPENYIDTAPDALTLASNKPKRLNKKIIIAIVSVIAALSLLSVGVILVYRKVTIDKFKNIIINGLISYEKEAHNNDKIMYDDFNNSLSIVEIYKYDIIDESLITYGIFSEGTVLYPCYFFASQNQNNPKTRSGYYEALVEYDISSGKYNLLFSRGPYSYDELSPSEEWTRII